MSLQKYIRQVKPRNESYTPPVEQVQQFFLTEGTDFSTAMESVLGIAYAAAALGGDRGREYLKKEATTGKFKKDFNLTKQVHTNKKVLDIDALMEFGENIKKVVAGDGNFAFQGKGVQTPDWQKWKGRGGKDTSKTDIVLGGKHCSVKNAAGAQLMSGKKGESIATTCAASEASGLDGDVTGDILQSINALQTITTEGYFASVENLKKLQERGGGQRLYDFAKGEVEAYDAALTAWESKEGALKKDKPKKPTKEIYRVYNNKDLADKMPTLIDGVNKQFLDDMDTKFNVAADEVKTKLSDAFKGNNDFKLAFVYEAASGTRKFGDVIQRAQYVLSWERKSNIKDFKINLYPIPNRNAETIKTYASQIDLIVNWKSSSKANHLGYNAWQNIRLGLKKTMEKEKEALLDSYNVIEKYELQLNEGYLSEFAFWDKVKEVTKQLIDKAKQLWDQFITWFKMLVEKIKEAAEDGLKALSNIMGLELDTEDTLRNNRRLKLK
jgi:hypothetical protein